MKHIKSTSTALFAIALLALVGLVTFAGKPEKAERESLAAPAPKLLQYTWTLDTLSNANNDTITVPWVIQSRYTGALQITRTSISGTANVAVSIQASVTNSSSTDVTWVTVATTTATTATAELLTLAETYGQRYRIIVDGTGTQSTSYRLSWLGKRLPSE
jgi:hypothetical protein